MNFWLIFWIIILVFGVTAFAVLALIVTITGLGNIRTLFRSLDAQHRQNPPLPPEQ